VRPSLGALRPRPKRSELLNYFVLDFVQGFRAGHTRADNLAAFGVGTAIADSIKELGSFKTSGVPTAAEVKDVIERLFGNPEALKAAVNIYRSYLTGSPEISVDALSFTPLYGGFNLQSLQKPDVEAYRGANGLDYFKNTLKPAYDAYVKATPPSTTPMSLDDYLLWNYQNYTHPQGRWTRQANGSGDGSDGSLRYWKK
jgi:hypothetical protein